MRMGEATTMRDPRRMVRGGNHEQHAEMAPVRGQLNDCEIKSSIIEFQNT
jgi:hypothetical protein